MVVLDYRVLRWLVKDARVRKDLLRGKVALVVGASSESGPVVRQVLARHGANVALTYRSQEAKADQVAEEYRHHGVKACTFHFDLHRRKHTGRRRILAFT